MSIFSNTEKKSCWHNFGGGAGNSDYAIAIGGGGRSGEESLVRTHRRFKDVPANELVNAASVSQDGVRITSDDGNLYMILSSEGTGAHKTTGLVYALRPADRVVMAMVRGCGVTGSSSHTVSWDEVIVPATDGDVFMVAPSSGEEAMFYVVHDNNVRVATRSRVAMLYATLGIDIPFTMQPDSRVDPDEWVRL